MSLQFQCSYLIILIVTATPSNYNIIVSNNSPPCFSLIDDIYAERLTKLNTRRSLEDSWNRSMEEKQTRMFEDLNHSKQPSILLHQQCERYHRYYCTMIFL